ncbi:glycine cleavage system protein T [Skermanella aerolata]|uniref:Glycine cleavage system protein T n=1 Tax=Skermanella aerolata TaxID=393310 RepID=A0A512DQG5_9PROT|nr:folate-binding protein YgfZ [Skermanella aerolata]KJB93428.1 glycine cleavage system protein T [Skermanella aerolata KACC 11604]GEO38699.1 glycine cleavage system protein T [Skermanella aerolata]
MSMNYVTLPSRGILAIDGPDRATFLQGLVSNDVTFAGPSRAIYAAFLTPQGKYLHDFFIVEMGGKLLIDCEAGRLADLQRRLKMYKLRSKVALEDVSAQYSVTAAFGPGALEALNLPAGEPGGAAELGGGVVFADPRLSALGARAILPRGTEASALEAAGFKVAEVADYDRLRLEAGVPDGSRDLIVEKAILLENNLDELNAISWQKGCYMGQELTARTRYRGLVRKRLFPVIVEGTLPAPGTTVMLGDKEAGEMRSGSGDRALALLRLEEIERAQAEGLPLLAGDAKLTPVKPSWVNF